MDGDEHNEVEETSSKRRERLLALRSAANASPAAAPPPPAPAPSLLPDPDLAGDHQAAAPRAVQPHRFDYYTNPAAAFSSSYSSSSGGGGGSNPTYSHKRKSPPRGSYAPRPAPPPPHHYDEPGNYGLYFCPPHHRNVPPLPIYYPSLMQSGAQGNILWQKPMQFQTRISRNQGIAPGARSHWGPHFTCPARGSCPNSPSFAFRHTNSSQREGGTWMNYVPGSSSYSSHGQAGPGNYGSNYPPSNQHYMAPSPMRPPSPMPHDAPGSSPWRGPMQFQDPSSGYQGTPGVPAWGPHSGSAGRGSYPNSTSFGFRHPTPGRGGNPKNYRPRGSPHASYGRGSGQNYNSSPGSWGRGGRGAVGFQYNSGEDRRSYVNKSMVDDPWQDLQPIVGNIMIPRAWGGSKSWLPESLREKKETSAHGQIKSTSSGLSLAEYLDLSFNEASNET